MKVTKARNSGFFAAAAVLAAATTMAAPALAQGDTPQQHARAQAKHVTATPPPAAAPAAEPAILHTTHLDGAWAHALQSVLDDMQQLTASERLAAALTLAQGVSDAETPVMGSAPPARIFLRSRVAWLPPGALRDALDQSPWELAPAVIEPGTETPADTHGQYGILPGARMTLPWMLP